MFVRALGAALLISLGVLAPVANAQTSVSIKAPRQVKPGVRFTVKTHVTLPATAFITGGFMDFVNADPSPSRQKCPATPKGTFAADTPQSPQPAGVVSSTTRVRNVVKRTGVLRFCLWVIDEASGEQVASGAKYVKALAPRKKRPVHHARAAAVSTSYKGHTTQARSPIVLRIAGRHIRDLTYTAQFGCSDGLTVQWSSHLAEFAFGATGRFDATPAPFGTQNDLVSIGGSVRNGRVSGSFTETYTSVLGNTCRTGQVGFNARKPPRRR